MKNIILLFALYLSVGWVAFGQFTNVTATITDSDSQTWNNGTCSLYLYNPYQANQPSINGTPLTNSQLNPTCSMSNSGVLTVTAADNLQVAPTGTYWVFTIKPNASVQASVVSSVVTGTSENLSSVLSAGLRQLRFPATSTASGATAFGYLDAEVSPAPNPGGQYYNVTSNCLRIYSGSPGNSWSCLAGGSAGLVNSVNSATGAITIVGSGGTGVSTVGTVVTVNSIAPVVNFQITTSAGNISANTCTGLSTFGDAGLMTTSSFSTSFASDPSAVTGWGATGGLVLVVWPTLNTVNWKVCNQSNATINAGSIVINIGANF